MPPMELLRLSFLTKKGFNRTGGSGRDLSFEMDKAGFVKFCSKIWIGFQHHSVSYVKVIVKPIDLSDRFCFFSNDCTTLYKIENIFNNFLVLSAVGDIFIYVKGSI